MRRIVGLISAADSRVCRRHFTQRYVDQGSDRRGEEAYRKCERDIAGSKGSLEVAEVTSVRVSGETAVVRFTLRVAGQLSEEGWRMVRADGGWLVDGRP